MFEQEFILAGDLNTNVACNTSSHPCKGLKSICTSFSLKQLITYPTRITSSSKSTIDLILVSDTNKVSQSGVLDTYYTDHQVIYCTRKCTKQSMGKHNTIKIRTMKNYRKELFNTKLREANLYRVIDIDNIDEAWQIFNFPWYNR